MKSSSLPSIFFAIALGACILSPTASYADRKDRHRHGFSHRFHGHRHDRDWHRHHHHHHHGYYRPYYRPRPYYGYYSGYHRPYVYSYGPSIGLSFSSRPSYRTERYVYRTQPRSSASYESSLAVDVQQALRRRGYYKGSIDGDIGPASRSAIRAYQADRGLPVTGRIDRSLLNALGIG